MIEIVEINFEEFVKDIYPHYVELFPEKERRSLKSLKRTHEKGIEKFYKFLAEGETVGFFTLEKLDEEYPFYLDYFAILKDYQNNGYGKKGISKILNEIVKDATMCIDIETEDENNIETIRRAEFYKSLGFQKVESEFILYEVSYTPYKYDKENKLTKDDGNNVLLDYYFTNTGKDNILKNYKLLY